VASVDRS